MYEISPGIKVSGCGIQRLMKEKWSLHIHVGSRSSSLNIYWLSHVKSLITFRFYFIEMSRRSYQLVT
ncbi:hypothetical protein MJ1HA_1910 [Metallosphaera sedula]|nr:hypothetical protein MJ1HA_1910 [Metallosphaera sedula]